MFSDDREIPSEAVDRLQVKLRGTQGRAGGHAGDIPVSCGQEKLQAAEWRDGHYLLRSNLTAGDPSVLWTRYVQLTQIESVFRSLKSEVGIRPIYHPLERRADAHILIAFLAHCLQITLKQGLLLHAPGLTPAASAGEVSRNPNDRSVDSCRRSTVVDSAALHATIARHQAGNREVETGAAESAAAATHCANENNEIEVQAVR